MMQLHRGYLGGRAERALRMACHAGCIRTASALLQLKAEACVPPLLSGFPLADVAYSSQFDYCVERFALSHV